MFSLSNMPSTTSVLSTYTTFVASAMLVRTVLNEAQNLTTQLIPQQLQEKILSKLGGIMENLSSQMTLIFDENNGLSINEIFEASESYLRTKISPSVQRLKVSKTQQEDRLSVTINRGEKIIDAYEGIQLTWEMICTESRKTTFDYECQYSSENVEHRSFELSFHKKHKEMVLSTFLPHLLERAKAMKEQIKAVKLHALGGIWESVNLDHPSTFDTLAMDPTLKKELIDDLDKFVTRRNFYRRVGKAWKHGYLLYGPPGTGKSSLIAAMANYLKFDIYDLELASIHTNSELRKLLVSTANRSIVVIEDIDCSMGLQNRQAGEYYDNGSQLTLSWLLNFIDGLWSSCGNERIIVFTTNHKDRPDPALLRPGCMDMHIHMFYSTPCGFRILASNYRSINNHSLFTEIEKLISEVEVTPAEIAEELMKTAEIDIALRGLVEFLKRKRIESGQTNAEGGKEIDQEGKESEETKEEGGKKVMNNKRKARGRKSKRRGF